jgi:GxxExxY protein
MKRHLEEVAALAIDCGLAIHRRYGPGLLESAYETLLTFALEKRGLFVERQKPLDIIYEGGLIRAAFKIDLMVDGGLIIELKSVDQIAPVHARQLLTYLRLADRPLGLLMNFGSETFREGLRRVSNNYFAEWNSP